MPRVRVANLSDLPPGSVIEAEAQGRSVALCNVDGELFALDGICPHAGGRLGHGALHGVWVTCPWHAWEFDCRTGEHDYNPDVKLDRYQVSVEGGEIVLEIPDSSDCA